MHSKVVVLGSNSALPAHGRNPSAQLFISNEKYYLIDCGEGTQTQIRKQHYKMQRVDYIFISHLHGDHYFGLIALLSSLHLLGREKEIHLFADKKLQDILNLQFEASKTLLQYPLHFHAIENRSAEIIYENDDVTVKNIPLKHQISTNGFLFTEKQKPKNIKKEAIAQYNLDYKTIQDIKNGHDLRLESGIIIQNSELTLLANPPKSYAYCSDTAYYENIIPIIKNVDLLYHETTYLQHKQENAKKRFHSTTIEAANMAKQANAKKLIIGHFSSRYKDLQLFLDEARSIFPNTDLALEGNVFEL